MTRLDVCVLAALVLTVSLSAGAQTSSALSAATPPRTAAVAPVVAISQISQSLLRNRVTVQGEVISHTPPRTDRAPHSLMLRDATGIIRVAVWKDLWDRLAFRDKIEPGTKLTVKMEIVDFKGGLEGHPSLPDDMTLGIADPKSLSAAPGLAAINSPDAGFKVISADPVQWQPDLTAAMRLAAQTRKNILVFYENPDVEASRQVDVNVFGDARARAIVNEKCVPLRISMTRQKDLAKSLGAFRAGVVILYKSDGTALKRLDNLATPEDLIRQLP